ncbi:hypothetical protein Q3G72_030315 [Acer saccharum]|nr:hypothetical protein Q3G72_030315 [Acer saccharum]
MSEAFPISFGDYYLIGEDISVLRLKADKTPKEMANVEVQIAYNVELRFSKDITALLSKVMKKFGKLLAMDENNFPHITILSTQSPSTVEEFRKCFGELDLTAISMDTCIIDEDKRLTMEISSPMVARIKLFHRTFCSNFQNRIMLKSTWFNWTKHICQEIGFQSTSWLIMCLKTKRQQLRRS